MTILILLITGCGKKRGLVTRKIRQTISPDSSEIILAIKGYNQR